MGARDEWSSGDGGRPEEVLRHQLTLAEAVAAIASRLIGAPPDQVTGEIERGLAELAQVMGADRAHFVRRRSRPDDATCVEWRNPETVSPGHGATPDPGVQRWWTEVRRADRLLRVEDVVELADEAPHVVQALREDGVRSLLHVPLPRHRGHWGSVTMVAVRGTVSSSEDATAVLRRAGECFMTALARCDDASARQDARRRLEHRNEQLERSNEELERFAHSAAHDLKAPLSRIEMALSADPSGAAPAPELLQIARRGASRMRQLIEDLLALASVGRASGAAVPVDLDALLDDVLLDLEGAMADGAARVERSELPAVLGHRALLGQLLQNLLANAIKFGRPGTPVIMRVEARREDDGVTISVLDNGIGIAPAHRREVFGAFTRLDADEASPGSGIGLATCARVAHHHGGRIWVDDGIDGGTAVRVWLPHEAIGD